MSGGGDLHLPPEMHCLAGRRSRVIGAHCCHNDVQSQVSLRWEGT